MQKIMFNDQYGLMKAVLDGKKTQTRRIIPESWLKDIEKFQEEYFNNTLDCLEGKELMEQYFLVDRKRKPRYAVDEILAVAMSYKDIAFFGLKISEKTLRPVFVRTEPDDSIRNSPGWNNKMFVKSELLPEHIRITGIRLERLQDISDEDCLKEGIRRWEDEKEYLSDDTVRKSIDELKAAGYDTYAIPRHWNCYTSPREAYADLIDKVSGKGTWEKNPWVFVYDFELVK